MWEFLWNAMLSWLGQQIVDFALARILLPIFFALLFWALSRQPSGSSGKRSRR